MLIESYTTFDTAKDNLFEASFRFEPDNTLPKINVVPQDIGRVLLNLISNGFQAVGEKVKSETGNVKVDPSSVSPFTFHLSLFTSHFFPRSL